MAVDIEFMSYDNEDGEVYGGELTISTCDMNELKSLMNIYKAIEHYHKTGKFKTILGQITLGSDYNTHLSVIIKLEVMPDDD